LYKQNAITAYFSLSPSHFDTRSDDDTEKKVELPASVATAFAKYDFPVPGGYTNTQHSSWVVLAVGGRGAAASLCPQLCPSPHMSPCNR